MSTLRLTQLRIALLLVFWGSLVYQLFHLPKLTPAMHIGDLTVAQVAPYLIVGWLVWMGSKLWK